MLQAFDIIRPKGGLQIRILGRVVAAAENRACLAAFFGAIGDIVVIKLGSIAAECFLQVRVQADKNCWEVTAVSVTSRQGNIYEKSSDDCAVDRTLCHADHLLSGKPGYYDWIMRIRSPAPF